jgi:hypothetical protein
MGNAKNTRWPDFSRHVENLTPQQSSLPGNGEYVCSPLLRGEGLRERFLTYREKYDQPLEILTPLMQRKRFHYEEFSAFSNAYIELLVAKKQRDGARAWLKMWEGIDPEHLDVLRWKDKLEGGFMRLAPNDDW